MAAIELAFKLIDRILDEIEQRSETISVEEQAKTRSLYQGTRDRLSAIGSRWPEQPLEK